MKDDKQNNCSYSATNSDATEGLFYCARISGLWFQIKADMKVDITYLMKDKCFYTPVVV